MCVDNWMVDQEDTRRRKRRDYEDDLDELRDEEERIYEKTK